MRVRDTRARARVGVARARDRMRGVRARQCAQARDASELRASACGARAHGARVARDSAARQNAYVAARGGAEENAGARRERVQEDARGKMH